MSSEVSAHLTQLQERLQQEEESVVALREEGRMKEQQMGKLMKSLEEVNRMVSFCIYEDKRPESLFCVASLSK